MRSGLLPSEVGELERQQLQCESAGQQCAGDGAARGQDEALDIGRKARQRRLAAERHRGDADRASGARGHRKPVVTPSARAADRRRTAPVAVVSASQPARCPCRSDSSCRAVAAMRAPFLDLERELARRDEIRAEPDRQDPLRALELGRELCDLRPQRQRLRRSASFLRCASRDPPRDGRPGEDRAGVGHRVAPRAVAERRHQRRDPRRPRSASRRARRSSRSPRRPRAPRRARGSSRGSCRRARCRCTRRRHADRARHRAPAAARHRREPVAAQRFAEQRGNRHAAVLGRAAARHDDRLARARGPGTAAAMAVRAGRRGDRLGEPRSRHDHLLHHPRRPVAQLGIALAVPAEIVGDHASPGGCSSVATATRFQALIAMITPIRLPSSASSNSAAAAS